MNFTTLLKSMFAKQFKDLNKTNSDIAGGKGASLGEMTNAGIPVPPGFVILSTTFDKFIQEAKLDKEIIKILKTVNTDKSDSADKASEKIKELILKAKVSGEIEAEIMDAFEALKNQPHPNPLLIKEREKFYVAVRSSATAEDGAEHAWAGQLESYLNTTEKDLLEKVKKCWASLFTPRAIFYRIEKKLDKQKISVAVVVQKMVESEVSGIAFSVHPVTEDYNQLIIEAGLGLGEAIVSGSITPDSYIVAKDKKKIEEKNISEQNRGLFRKQNGGSEWREIDAKTGGKQKLSDKQIIELSKLIIKIEEHYGFPCDIEWAFEGGKFYIVQSRPITTLKG